MKWGLLSIASDGCRNRGNHLIEQSMLNLVGTPPSATVSVFRKPTASQLRALSVCDLLLCAGATLFDASDHTAVLSIAKLGVPIVCASGAFMCQPGDASLEIVQALAQPIGVRDGFSFEFLTRNGYQVVRTGCPTMGAFMGARNSMGRRPLGEKPKVLFSFGRGSREGRIAVAKALDRHVELEVLSHEDWDTELATLSGIQCKSTPLLGVDQVTALLARADIVVSGRMHLVLPAIAAGRPAILFAGERDSRFSLFDELSIPTLPEREGLVMSALESALAGGGTPPLSLRTKLETLASDLRRFLYDWGFPLREPIGDHSYQS